MAVLSMRKLTRLVSHYVWPSAEFLRRQAEEEERRRQEQLAKEEAEQRRRHEEFCRFVIYLKKFVRSFENIVLWENTEKSWHAVCAYNVIYWALVLVAGIRSLSAAGSAALVLSVGFSALEALDEIVLEPGSPQFTQRLQRLKKQVKSFFDDAMQLQKEEPSTLLGMVAFVLIVSYWLIGPIFDTAFFYYLIFLGALTVPGILLRCPSKYLPGKGSDNDMDDFLPATTEANLQLLQWAGETGQTPTPPSSPDMEVSQEQFEDDLVGLRMPSHEDGSTDGLDLSELELSAGESDVDGIRFKSAHFERAFESSDDEDLSIDPRAKLNHDDDDDEANENSDSDNSDNGSDSEFEIIDSNELANLKDV